MLGQVRYAGALPVAAAIWTKQRVAVGGAISVLSSG